MRRLQGCDYLYAWRRIVLSPPEPGIRRCMSCDDLFVSPDPQRIRRCSDCHRAEDNYPGPGGRINTDIVAAVLACESPSQL